MIELDPNGTYKMAHELNGPAREIINKYHPYLADAKMACLFRAGSWKVKDVTQLGKAVIAPQTWRCLTGYDLLLIVNEVIYCSLSDKGKKALLDHVLSYIKEPAVGKHGAAIYGTRDHDIREFSAVVKRHNVCFSNLRAIEEDGTFQLSLLEPLAKTVEASEELYETHQAKEIVEDPILLEEHDDLEELEGTVLQEFNFDR